jgi:hypothetical protein
MRHLLTEHPIRTEANKDEEEKGNDRERTRKKYSALAHAVGQAGTVAAAEVPSFVPGRLPGQGKSGHSWILEVPSRYPVHKHPNLALGGYRSLR